MNQSYNLYPTAFMNHKMHIKIINIISLSRIFTFHLATHFNPKNYAGTNNNTGAV